MGRAGEGDVVVEKLIQTLQAPLRRGVTVRRIELSGWKQPSSNLVIQNAGRGIKSREGERNLITLGGSGFSLPVSRDQLPRGRRSGMGRLEPESWRCDGAPAWASKGDHRRGGRPNLVAHAAARRPLRAGLVPDGAVLSELRPAAQACLRGIRREGPVERILRL